MSRSGPRPVHALRGQPGQAAAQAGVPAALPAIFAGLRIAAGLSVIGAIVGDFFFKQGAIGIGQLMDIYRANLRSEQLFGAVILSSLLGLVVFWLFGWLARRVTGSWHETAASEPLSE